MTLVARHGALSDIGLHRKTNEDTYVVEPPLYAVCDGMGGANAGEVASGLAAETLAAEVARGTPIHAAAEAANAAVYQRAHDNVEQTGHGHHAHGVRARGQHGAVRPHRRQPRLPVARRRAAAGERRPLAGRRDGAGRPPDRRRGGRAPSSQHPQPRARHRARARASTSSPRTFCPATCCCSAATASAGRCRPTPSSSRSRAATRRPRRSGSSSRRASRAGRTTSPPSWCTWTRARTDRRRRLGGDHARPAGRPGIRRGHRRAAVRRRRARA